MLTNFEDRLRNLVSQIYWDANEVSYIGQYEDEILALSKSLELLIEQKVTAMINRQRSKEPHYRFGIDS